MSSALAPLRILLGALCVFFAYYFGRSLGARLQDRASNIQVMRWVLRVAVTALGTVWNGLDRLAVAMLVLAAVSAGLGFYGSHRPARRTDDPTDILFPRD